MNRQTPQPKKKRKERALFALNPPPQHTHVERKRCFCHCCAASQDIRMAHCEGEKREDLRSKHLPNQSLILGLYTLPGRTQCAPFSSSSSLGRAVITVQCCTRLNNTQGVLQSGGKPVPFLRKGHSLRAPTAAHCALTRKKKKNLTNRCVRGLAGLQLLFDANVHQTQTGQDLPEELGGSLRESPALSLQELRALGNN